MTVAQTPHARRHAAFVVLLLVAGLVLGVMGVLADYESRRAQVVLTRDEVQRNGELLQRITQLEEESRTQVAEHRDRNQHDHDDLCRIIYDVVVARGIPNVEPCGPAPSRD